MLKFGSILNLKLLSVFPSNRHKEMNITIQLYPSNKKLQKEKSTTTLMTLIWIENALNVTRMSLTKRA